MTVREELIAMKVKLEKGWHQEAYARTKTGTIVEARDPDAVSWCIVGAWSAINGQQGTYIFLEEFLNNHEHCGILGFNDHIPRTKKEVIDMPDEVIKVAP